MNKTIDLALTIIILATMGFLAIMVMQVEQSLDACEYALQEFRLMHDEALIALEQCYGS